MDKGRPSRQFNFVFRLYDMEVINDTAIFNAVMKDRQFSTFGEFKSAWETSGEQCIGRYKTANSRRYCADDCRLAQLEYEFVQYGCRDASKKKQVH